MVNKGVVSDSERPVIPMHTSLVEKGRRLEDVIEISLNDLSISYERNRINGVGADFMISEDSNILIEAKNWAAWKLTPSMSHGHIKSRFVRSDPEHRKLWVLIISKLTCSDVVIAQLALNGIHVIQLEFEVEDNRHSKRQAARIITKKLKKLLRLFTSDSVVIPCFNSFSDVDDVIVVSSLFDLGSNDEFYAHCYEYKLVDDGFYQLARARAADSLQTDALAIKYFRRFISDEEYSRIERDVMAELKEEQEQ